MENKAFDDIQLQAGAEESGKRKAATTTVAIKEADELSIEYDGPFAGMGKDELLKYSQAVQYRVARWLCLILLTSAWCVMLAMAIVIIVTTPKCLPWWELSTFYQIFPRSFYDSDGDGIGDLKGITEKVGYLSSLGIGAVLLNSIYASSNQDCGYDVTDYTAVDERLGTMKEFEEMLDALHGRDIKVVLDFIPNHSSNQHPWFKNDDKYEDFYTWTSTPNNWVSLYSGSAWDNDPRGQYYLHQYSKYQPDLNFANPVVQGELEIALEYWFTKGIDGFNMHSMKYLYEIQDLRDEPVNPAFHGPTDPKQYESVHHYYTADYLEHPNGNLHDVLHKWRTGIFDQFSTAGTYRLMMTDSDTNSSYVKTYYGTSKRPEADVSQNFNLVKLGDPLGEGATTTGKKVEELIKDWMKDISNNNWPSFMLGNHEVHRVASRLGPKYAKAVNMLLLTLPGTPICYYGDEIGMEDIEMTRETTLDIRARNDLDRWKEKTRDPERSPMQWSNMTNAGFSQNLSGTWLPVNENYRSGTNVKTEEANEGSILNMFKHLVILRKTERAFQNADIQHDLYTDEIVSYVRGTPDNTGNHYFVAINLGTRKSEDNYYALDPKLPLQGTIVVSTDKNRQTERGGRVQLNRLALGAGEGVVVLLDKVVDVPEGKPFVYQFFKPA